MLIQTNANKPFRKIQERQAICQDCGNVWIKVYKGCKVKKPQCFMCKSKNTTIRKVNYEQIKET